MLGWLTDWVPAWVVPGSQVRLVTAELGIKVAPNSTAAKMPILQVDEFIMGSG